MSTELRTIIPRVYLAKDASVPGEPLARLLTVLDAELAELEAASDRLLDDHFVERASPEALLLIAELFGARFFTSSPRTHRAILSRVVAWRRRKGTLATLEEVLRVTSGWYTEVDEAFRSILATQDLAAPLPWRGRTAVMWDPIALSDPLTRRAPDIVRPRDDERILRAPVLEPLEGESISETLARLGRADAGRYAASPRTLDLRGWARPDVVVVRAAKVVPVPIADTDPRRVHTLSNGRRGFRIDPADRDGPLAWSPGLEPPYLAAARGDRYEPEPERDEQDARADMLLTPTALAEDADRAEAVGAFRLDVGRIPVIADDVHAEVGRGVAIAPIAAEGSMLRLADEAAPSPGDGWRIELHQWNDPTVTELSRRDVGAAPPPTVSADGLVQRSGTARVRLARTAGDAHVRRGDGSWVRFDPGVRGADPISNVVDLRVAGVAHVARIERGADDANLRVAWIDPAGAIAWSGVEAGSLDVMSRAGIALTAVPDALILAGFADDDTLGVWRVDDPTGAPALTRLDTPGARRPQPRRDAAIAVTAGRVYVHGGERDAVALSDTWSVPLAGGAWTAHGIRRPTPRIGAQLLVRGTELVRIGGYEEEGALSGAVHVADLAEATPTWREAPSLPIPSDGAGRVVATYGAGAIQALVWADHARPFFATLVDGARRFDRTAVDPLGAAPPAYGEATFVDDEVWIAGPTPLPPSQVMFSLGGAGHLAYLPAVDALSGGAVTFDVDDDGASRRVFAPGVAAEDLARPGAPMSAQSILGRAEAVYRLGVPTRLSHAPFVLRQRNLASWDALGSEAPDPRGAGVIGLDPRLGRVLLGTEVPNEPVRYSAYGARGARIGPGVMPRSRALETAWRLPGEGAWPTPPDVVPADAAAAERAPTRIAIAPGALEAALRVASVDAPTLEVIGSGHLPAARLAVDAHAKLSIAAEIGETPALDADGVDLSLGVYVEHGGQPESEVWLAGLALEGGLDLVLARGTVDLRWLAVGQPGREGVRVAGAGHQTALARRSIPPAEVTLRLVGCTIARLDVPPWVQVDARGCTFDGGADDADAIAAPGARIRLVHCTVRGHTAAGLLEASSSVFSGPIAVARRDLGYLRYCCHARGGTPPAAYRSTEYGVSFESHAPASPGYLVLAENNAPHVLAAGEERRVPGAHAERSEREAELYGRTDAHLPIGTRAHHINRTSRALERMERP